MFFLQAFFFLLFVLLPSFTICSAGLNELILIISFNLVLNASTVHTLGKNVLTFWKIIWKSTVVMNSIVKSFFLLHCKELMYSSSGEAFKFCNDFTFSLVWSIRIAFFQAYSSLNSIWEEKLFSLFPRFLFLWLRYWLNGWNQEQIKARLSGRNEDFYTLYCIQTVKGITNARNL